MEQLSIKIINEDEANNAIAYFKSLGYVNKYFLADKKIFDIYNTIDTKYIITTKDGCIKIAREEYAKKYTKILENFFSKNIPEYNVLHLNVTSTIDILSLYLEFAQNDIKKCGKIKNMTFESLEYWLSILKINNGKLKEN